jgi:CheY-like chemotaxis protein
MARILIVDGHDLVRLTLADLFEAAGHEVELAADGVQALESFAARTFDVVLLEAYMPRMDGFEACRRLRQESKVPILMLSTSGEPSLRERALACGADGFLPKPVEFERLLGWVCTRSARLRGSS